MRWLALVALLAPFAPATANAQITTFTPPDPVSRVKVENNVWTAISTACPAIPLDAGLRQRLVDVASTEWARFQFPVNDHRKRNLQVVVSPEGGALIPDTLNARAPGIVRQSLRLGYMEDDEQVREAIGGYWTAVPGTDALEAQTAIFRTYSQAGWAHPWSAAFISYVMCAAGVADMAQFKRAEGHWYYVDQAIQAADDPSSPAIFSARDLTQGLPHVGDLVCADRASKGTSLRTIADRRAAPGARIMHCDLVVKVDTRAGYVAMIGGNVVQSVTLTLVKIVKGKGGAQDRIEIPADTPGGRPWFAILALRAPPSEASLDKSPAIQAIHKR